MILLHRCLFSELSRLILSDLKYLGLAMGIRNRILLVAQAAHISGTLLNTVADYVVVVAQG